jgi:hypothetical protein
MENLEATKESNAYEDRITTLQNQLNLKPVNVEAQHAQVSG